MSEGPQLENGYTPVAHEIFDQICKYNFNGAQFRILIKIWRMTYGYHRKDNEFSITFLHQETNLSEGTVKKELSHLIKSNVLIVTKEATNLKSRKLSFNKYFDEWNFPKGGNSMPKKSSVEGSDWIPQELMLEGSDRTPLEVYDCTPPSNDFSYFEGSDQTPIKRYKRSLNISFKDKVNLFDYFYSEYPRKVSKAAAKRAWEKLCKDNEFDYEFAIDNTKNFAATCELLQTETKYIPHPSTYLNQKRYEDYPTVDPEGLAAGKQSKFGSNLDFLKDQIGGESHEQGSSGGIAGKSLSSLPEQSSRFQNKPSDI